MSAIVLASTSLVRARLLAAAGVDFRVEAPPYDEEAAKRRRERESISAAELALELARGKAASVAGAAVVIGADQTLCLGGACLHKAADLAQARGRLLALRGRTHQLHAAVALARGGVVTWSVVVTASLTMRAFSREFLEHYLARHGESLLGSVGCYRLEEDGVQLFETIEGDYFAILGLPLVPLLGALRATAALAT